MDEIVHNEGGKTEVRSWLIVIALAAGFILWGLLIFFAIGDRGMPTWDFGIVEDIPGQSQYSTHSQKVAPGLVSQPFPGNMPEEQHVMEPPKPPAGLWKGETDEK